jgi:hypothetical protein
LIFNGEKRVLSATGAETTGHPPAKRLTLKEVRMS